MVCSNVIKIHCIYILANVCASFAQDNFCTSFAQDNFCTSMYISKNGFNCSYCPAGSYKEGPCAVDNGGSICRPCPPGHFESSCNIALSCQPCRNCTKSGYVVKEPCTPQKETVCICPDGKYFQRETNVEGICLDHTICPPGEVVRAEGTPWNDTVCVKITTESPTGLETSTQQTDTTSGHQIDTPSEKTEDGTYYIGHIVGSVLGGLAGGFVAGVLVTISMFWWCRQKKYCCFSKRDETEKLPEQNGIDKAQASPDYVNRLPKTPSQESENQSTPDEKVHSLNKKKIKDSCTQDGKSCETLV